MTVLMAPHLRRVASRFVHANRAFCKIFCKIKNSRALLLPLTSRGERTRINMRALLARSALKTAGLILPGALAALFCASVFAAPNEASFTPVAIRKPIREIGFQNSAASLRVPLYTCAGGSEAACLVDIADEAALAGLFAAPVSIAPGTYDRVYVAHCTTEGAYHALVRGSVTLGGTTYYTADTAVSADPLTTVAADQGEVSLRYNGCVTDYLLPSPLTVAAGDSISLSLFVLNTDIAWARLAPSLLSDGCRQNPGGTHSVCMTYPEIVPSLGSSTPQLERYYIIENLSDPATVGAEVLLVTDAVSDAVLAGFTRRLFSPTSQPPAGGFDTRLKSILPSGTGTYALENFGFTATDTGLVRFPAFRRVSHAGNYLRQDGSAIPYYAYRDVMAELPACGAEPLFTASPVTIDSSVTPAIMPDFSNIVPLGNFNPTGGHVFPTDHMYFALKLVSPADPSSDTVTSTVYSPGNIWITEITRQVATYPDSTTYTDYTVRIGACREVAAYFHHLHVLSPTLAAAFSAAPLGPGDCSTHATGGNTYETCTAGMKLTVTAGAPLATVGGNHNVYAFDLGAMDTRVAPLAFANPARFSAAPNGLDEFHTVCPLDYFAAPAADQLRSFLRGFDGTPRTAPPLCGSVMQDIAGTAQGVWFKPATPTYLEDPHLTLAHDNIDPGYGVFSVGNAVTASGLAAGTYYFTPASDPASRINQNFADVGPSAIYCYDNLTSFRGGGPLGSMVILTQLADAATLRIEKRTAASCAALGAPATWSLSAYTIFNR